MTNTDLLAKRGSGRGQLPACGMEQAGKQKVATPHHYQEAEQGAGAVTEQA